MYSICKYKTFVIFYFTSNLPINTCTCMYDFVGYVIREEIYVRIEDTIDNMSNIQL